MTSTVSPLQGSVSKLYRAEVHQGIEARPVLKQRPTLNQSPTQSGRTHRQTHDVVMGSSADRDVRSCGAQFWCYHCYDGPWSCPSIVGQFHMDAVVV